MVLCYNPKSKRLESVDDYHYYDVYGHFPQRKKLKYRKRNKGGEKW